MPLSRSEAQNLATTSGKGFGRASPDRNAIIMALADGDYYSPAEIAQKTNLEEKVCATRCTVMVRDKLVDRRVDDNGMHYYGLTDKGLTRAAGKTEEKPRKKGKK